MRLRNLITALSLVALVACQTDDSKDDDDGGDDDVEIEGDDAGECSDGADNDRNGAFDCDDPGCEGSPDCDEDDPDDPDDPDDNTAPTAPTVTLAPAQPTTADDMSCTRVADASDPDGDDIIYIVRFLVDGVAVQESQSETLSHERFDKGQTLQCSMAATDGALTGESGVSDEVVVLNTTPAVSNVEITPSPATASDTLRCDYDFDDADRDPDASTRVWTINGTEAGTAASLSSGFRGGDEVSCTVTAADDTTVGNTDAHTILIDNSAPTIDVVTMTPADADIRDTLTCNPGTTADADGDTTFTYAYAWEIDGATIAATTQTLDAADFSVGSVVRCAATANDGVDDGDATWSDSQTILTGPDLQLSDTTWAFGTVESGCLDDAEITLTNGGTDTLRVSSVTVSGDVEYTTDFLTVLSIEPAGTETLTVSFSPGSEASYAGTITIASNDPDGDQTIALTGDGEWAAFSESTTGRTPDDIDILFAVDRSCSMNDDITDLEAAIGDMVTAMNTYGTDFQLAVTVEDSGCINGSDLWIDSTFSASDASDAASTMINLGGSYGSNTERAFTLFEAALDETGSGGCNEGLVRSSAKLALIGFSDEPEQSVGVWSDYVATFQALKADSDDVIIHGIGGDYPSGCATASAYTGFYEATVATGGTFISICTADLSTELEDLAWAHAEDSAVYPLENEPYDPTTIMVYVDGVDASGTWTYDATDNAVTFDSDLPDATETVLIKYDGTHLACE